jgi:hypothetical protein
MIIGTAYVKIVSYGLSSDTRSKLPAPSKLDTDRARLRPRADGPHTTDGILGSLGTIGEFLIPCDTSLVAI